MNPKQHTALLRSMAGLASRRGIIASLASGLVATGFHAFNVDDAEAKKKGKRKNKKRKNKKNDRAVTRADATCSVVETTGFEVNPNQRLAQTFTAGANGPLVRAELLIAKSQGSVGDYFLQLGTVDPFGLPTNEVSASTSVENSNVPDGESTVIFTFPTPFPVVEGTRYALVLTRTGPDLFSWRGTGDDPCAGQAFTSPDLTAPFVPFGSSATFDRDFVFTTFVRS
jgi:hypothetical protein